MDMSETKLLEEFEKLHGFAAPRKMKLSEAIRAGIPKVKNTRHSFRGCALGAAFFGITGRKFTYDDPLMASTCGEPPEDIAKLVGWDKTLCTYISTAHSRGIKTRLQCAQFAESMGC